MHVVYFIGSTDREGPIKIGVTGNLPARKIALQNGSSFELAVLATIPGGFYLEKRFHRRHRLSRLSGEWFGRTDQLMADIEAIARGSFDVACLNDPDTSRVDANYTTEQDRADLAQAAAMMAAAKALRQRVLARVRQRNWRAKQRGGQQ